MGLSAKSWDEFKCQDSYSQALWEIAAEIEGLNRNTFIGKVRLKKKKIYI
jgi:hypothetical protein